MKKQMMPLPLFYGVFNFFFIIVFLFYFLICVFSNFLIAPYSFSFHFSASTAVLCHYVQNCTLVGMTGIFCVHVLTQVNE